MILHMAISGFRDDNICSFQAPAVHSVSGPHPGLRPPKSSYRSEPSGDADTPPKGPRTLPRPSGLDDS